MDALACVLHAEKDLRIETVPVAEMKDDQVLVRIGAGGICGSDLHYFLAGGFGTVRIQEPMILGPEVAGTVQAVGAGVEKVSVGDRVALNPSRPCGQCSYCLDGQHQHCLNMKFYGSAMPMPHSQGAFRTDTSHHIAELEFALFGVQHPRYPKIAFVERSQVAKRLLTSSTDSGGIVAKACG